MPRSIIIIICCLLVGNVAATDVSVVDGIPNASYSQGDLVEFTLKISGLLPQVSKITLKTDLQPYGTFPLWNITETGFLQLSDGTVNYNNQTISFDVEGGSNAPVIIRVVGEVPQIAQSIRTHGLLITPTDVRTTGYTYYRFEARGKDNYPVGNAETKVFDIEIPEESLYISRLSTVQDQQLYDIIVDLHKKGLTVETKMLLDYSETKPSGISLLNVVFVAGVGVVTFLIGLRIGNTRGYEACTKQNEFKTQENETRRRIR